MNGLSDRSSFEDSYQGCWDSFGNYLIEEIELMQEGWPEEVIRYFDDDAYERDVHYDHTVLDTPEGGVFVFRP
ncbi:antirestriction protein ArdA [Corynebacterium durum]|uniref:antirestriction protein ArdA n=1 Tax=Corynebacterium durum TaxID=61592 RepID=UPI0036F3196E